MAARCFARDDLYAARGQARASPSVESGFRGRHGAVARGIEPWFFPFPTGGFGGDKFFDGFIDVHVESAGECFKVSLRARTTGYGPGNVLEKRQNARPVCFGEIFRGGFRGGNWFLVKCKSGADNKVFVFLAQRNIRRDRDTAAGFVGKNEVNF